jgi:hypothetical protein
MLARSKEVILALDSQHGIYRERQAAGEPANPVGREVPHNGPTPMGRKSAELGGKEPFVIFVQFASLRSQPPFAKSIRRPMEGNSQQ